MKRFFLIFVLLTVAYGTYSWLNDRVARVASPAAGDTDVSAQFQAARAASPAVDDTDVSAQFQVARAASPAIGDTVVSAQFQPEFTYYNDAYAQTQIRGWTVVVNRQLLETSDQAVTNMALALLDSKLADIERAVYRFPLRTLQRVPIWIENGTSGQHGLAYHWSAEWLREHGYNPEKAKAVEIHSLQDFVDWEPTQPWFVLHELAHAYHDQALGENSEDITNAYENARRLGLYENVKYRDGNIMPAYARVNRMEYFAELSEAYFGLNDFYPFNREDLRQHDPVGYELMEKVWR